MTIDIRVDILAIKNLTHLFKVRHIGIQHTLLNKSVKLFHNNIKNVKNCGKIHVGDATTISSPAAFNTDKPATKIRQRVICAWRHTYVIRQFTSQVA